MGIPVDTTAAATTFTKAVVTTSFATGVNPNLADPSYPEKSEGSDDYFYDPHTLDPSEAKRWYVPRWNITNDSLLDDGFSCRTLVDHVAPPAFFSALRTMNYDQLYTEFNVRAARQVCHGAEVRSRAEHELKLKEKLRAKYTARGRLLEEKDLEILKLKSNWRRRRWKSRRFLLSVPVFRILRKEWRFSKKSMPRSCRDVDFGMQEGLEASYEHGTAERNLFTVDAYNPKVAKASYINAVKALEDVDFPLVNLLKSKKDAGIDELSIPIHHAGDKTVVEETSLYFALMNVHARAEGAKKHVAALRQLTMEIVFAPLSSQTWVGEASTSVASLSVEDYDEEDTDEALGSVVAVPKLETYVPRSRKSKFISVLGVTCIIATVDHVPRLEGCAADFRVVVSFHFSLAFRLLNFRSVGMPISVGMTTSVSYVSENGVSPLLDLINVRCAHRTCESSPIQSLLLSSNRALIPSPKLLFSLSTKPFVCGCFTEAKHWRIHSFSHQSLNGLSQNCFPLSDTISPGRPNLQTMLSYTNFFT
ncbi:hypothetical protein Tco_1208923 [Tanacetum coccineum]